MTNTQTKPTTRRRTRKQTRQQIQKAQFWLSRYRSSYSKMDDVMYRMRVQIQLSAELSYIEREHLLGALQGARAAFTHPWSRMEQERLRWYARQTA